jgi:predicted homoserine dehydrogenase-like protein
MNIFTDLQRRQREMGKPIQVAVLGTGYFGSGLVRRIARIDGLSPAIAANRTLDKAIDALRQAGIDQARIRVCDDPRAAQAALDSGLHVATSSLTLAEHVPSVDVLMEATGDVLIGTMVAMAAIRARKHLVAANPETQATVGPILRHLADEAGVVYSDVDGDQPGIIKNLYDYCVGLGFEPLVAGNCKGVLKRYATPETQQAFASATGIKAWIASAAADGTKLNIEMAVVANATGMPPAVRGMYGPTTSLDTLLCDFERHGLFDKGPIVEYTLGIPNGTFLVMRGGDDPEVGAEFRYLKMGDGPQYLLYRPHVLVHYEAPLSAAEAVLYGSATIAPRPRPPVAEVVAVAKRDLRAGQRLDGIGGFDCYGLIATAEEAGRENLLPMGVAHWMRLTRDLDQDAPIPYDAVEPVEENLVLDLKARQARFLPFARVAGDEAALIGARGGGIA